MSTSLVFSSSRKSFNNQKICGLCLNVWCFGWCWYSSNMIDHSSPHWDRLVPGVVSPLSSSPSLFTEAPGAPEYSLYKINVGPDIQWFSSARTIKFNYKGIMKHFYKDTRRTESHVRWLSLRSKLKIGLKFSSKPCQIKKWEVVLIESFVRLRVIQCSDMLRGMLILIRGLLNSNRNNNSGSWTDFDVFCKS